MKGFKRCYVEEILEHNFSVKVDAFGVWSSEFKSLYYGPPIGFWSKNYSLMVRLKGRSSMLL